MPGSPVSPSSSSVGHALPPPRLPMLRNGARWEMGGAGGVTVTTILTTAYQPYQSGSTHTCAHTHTHTHTHHSPNENQKKRQMCKVGNQHKPPHQTNGCVRYDAAFCRRRRFDRRSVETSLSQPPPPVRKQNHLPMARADTGSYHCSGCV